ncbi:MAG TPA: hypothetical protein VM848_08345, partial [Acidimicrobiia bacterium]|nr:hypothetical protein [Acidimicrobiia bacterium]
SNHAYVVVEENQNALDVLTQAVSRDWIDQPAVARQAQLDPHRSQQLTSNGPGEKDEVGELERHVRQLIEQRLARTREVERTLGRGL